MRRQTRMKCAVCRAQWWHTPGSLIHPMDHARPDGRNCSNSRSNYAGEVMKAWDRLYPGDKEAAKQKERERLWEKEEVNRKARGRL